MIGMKSKLKSVWGASAAPLFDKEKHPATATFLQDMFYAREYSGQQIESAIEKLKLQGDDDKANKLKEQYENGAFDGKLSLSTATKNLTLTAMFAPVVIPGYLIKKTASFLWNGNDAPVIPKDSGPGGMS